MEYLKNTAKLKTIDINAIHTWGNGVILETARAYKHEIVYNSSNGIETNVYKYIWPYDNAPDRDYEYFEPELYELYAGGFDKYIFYAKECAGVNSRKLLEEALSVAKI